MMKKIFCRGYRFPPEIIQRAIWFYYRFTLSLRDVEELLAERGIEVTYETIRQWVIQFRPAIARDLRSRRPRPHSRRHMDEMASANLASKAARARDKARDPRCARRSQRAHARPRATGLARRDHARHERLRRSHHARAGPARPRRPGRFRPSRRQSETPPLLSIQWGPS